MGAIYRQYAEFVLLDITLFDAFMNAMFDDGQSTCLVKKPEGNVQV